jgi:hypothetical protein
MSPHAHLARSPVGLADKVWLEAVGREPGENSPWYRSHVLAQRPKLDSETLIPQEWLNLALSDATAAAGLEEDLAMHSCLGKMRGLGYQLAILTDIVETPSDASDHGSFPVASAWPKLLLCARCNQRPETAARLAEIVSTEWRAEPATIDPIHQRGARP